MKLAEISLRIRQWYLNHFVPYITIQQSNEHFFISRQLWNIINNDLPQESKSSIRIFFKYVEEGGYYLMIINPDMRIEFEDGVISEKAFAKNEERERRRKELQDKPRSYQIIEEVKRANEVMRKGKNKEEDESFPQTFPLQLNPFGRIGFQGTQPSPAMIIYKYNLDAKIKNKYGVELGFSDRLPLRVVPVLYRPESYDHRYAYIITPEVLHKPTKTFAKPMKRR